MGWRFIDHRHLLAPASEVPSWYDFASGLIGTAYTFEEMRLDIGMAPLGLDGEDNSILALAHEQAHFLQAITTPFLLHWSDTWLTLMSTYFMELDSHALATKGLRAAIADWSNPELVTVANRHLDKYFVPGVLGVDVFMMMESHATFLEVRAHTDATEPQQVLHYFNQCAPAPAYRRAYDVVRLWCGDRMTHEAFHAIFLAAMSTNDPARTFDRLVFECAGVHGDEFDNFINRCARRWADGLQNAHRNGRLGPHEHTFVPLAKNWIGELSAELLVRDPRTFGRFMHSPVVVFGANDVHKFGTYPGSLSSEAPDLEESERIAAFAGDFTLAALSQSMIRRRSQQVVASVLDDGFSWLETLTSEGFKFSVLVDNWGAKSNGPRELVDEAISRDVERLVSTIAWTAASTVLSGDALTHQEAQKPFHVPPHLVRRITLSFETQDEREVWQIPEIRQFIQQAHARIPWLPVLLRYPRHVDLLMVWFANLAPASLELIGGAGAINAKHADFLLVVEAFIDAVFDAAPDGADLSPAVSATLAALVLNQLA